VRRIILILVVAVAVVIVPTVATIVQSRGQAAEQTAIAAQQAKAKGKKAKAKEKDNAREAVPVEDRYVLFSDATLFALGGGAMLVGGGLLVYRIAHTEPPG
jgi:small-conductance mechanosensitive channel